MFTVSNEHFREFFDSLNTKLEIPCQATLRKDITQRDAAAVLKLKAFITRLGGLFVATSDQWSSTKSDGYSTMTLYIMDGDFELHSAVLGIFGLFETVVSVSFPLLYLHFLGFNLSYALFLHLYRPSCQ